MQNLFKKLLFLSFLIIITNPIFGQNQANVWYFGEGFGLDFNTNPPSMLSDGNTGLKVAEGEGVGSISDPDGNLLFYTNGQTIWNRNHVAMTNGTGLNGQGTTCQTAVIVPVPGSTTRYYMIATSSGGSDAVKYVIVDMTLNAGLGDVVPASKIDGASTNGTIIIPSTMNPGEGCVVIPEYNASNVPTGDYWVLFHNEGTGNNYYVAKITSTGITYQNTQSVGFGASNSVNQVCIMKTNSCFNKVATSFYVNSRVEVLPFNNVTGTISEPELILNGSGAGNPFLNTQVYGLEFSPSGQFLYVTESGLNSRYTVFQFDISLGTGTNPAAVLSSRRLFTAPGTTPYTPREDRFGDLQLGPDGKIYFPSVDTNAPGHINVIPTPDVQWAATPTIGDGLNIEFWKYKYSFGTRYMGEGLPPVLKNLLTEIRIYYNNACEGGTTSFSYLFGGSAVSHSWDFGDPASGAANTSTLANPTHVYNTAGTYTVTLTIIDNCGRTRTGTVDVIVKAGPQVSIPTNLCTGQDITLTGTGSNAANYTWSLNSNMSSPSGPSSTYLYNGTLPQTIYVEDPTPLATYTTGNNDAANSASSDDEDTRFDIFTKITLVSFQVKVRSTGSGTIVLQKWSGSAWAAATGTEAWSQSYTNISGEIGTLKTYSPDVILSAGRYRLFAADNGHFWKNNTSTDGGRDVGNVIDVFGDSNGGTKGGPYFNIVIDLPDPCGIRAYILEENCPLPVTWISFTAQAREEYINLIWNVTLEENNEKFIIQKSIDGLSFYNIGSVDTQEGLKSYTFNDFSPNNINYYRIKQVDFNGDYTYSVVRSVLLEKFNKITATPNPFSNELNINFVSDEAAIILVVDVLGRIIHQYKKPIGSYEYTIYPEILTEQYYIINVITSNKYWIIPVIKK